MADDDDDDMASNEPAWQWQILMSMDDYLELDDEVQRESEMVEGLLVAREPRDRPHQKNDR